MAPVCMDWRHFLFDRTQEGKMKISQQFRLITYALVMLSMLMLAIPAVMGGVAVAQTAADAPPAADSPAPAAAPPADAPAAAPAPPPKIDTGDTGGVLTSA